MKSWSQIDDVFFFVTLLRSWFNWSNCRLLDYNFNGCATDTAHAYANFWINRHDAKWLDVIIMLFLTQCHMIVVWRRIRNLLFIYIFVTSKQYIHRPTHCHIAYTYKRKPIKHSQRVPSTYWHPWSTSRGGNWVTDKISYYCWVIYT